MNDIIVSNRIACKHCKDVIFSRHRHDYRSCSCGKVAVDGGVDYLRRVGTDYDELSIVMPADVVDDAINAVKWAMNSNRTPRGIAYAVIRSLNDNKMENR